MAKKQAKEGSLDFFYLQQHPKEQPKLEKKRAKTNRPSKRTKKQRQKQEEIKQDVFDFDNEIVIGVNVIPKEKDKPSSKQKKKAVSNKSKNGSSKKTAKEKPIPQKKKELTKATSEKQAKKQKKKNKRIKKVLKIVLLLGIILAAGIFLMTTPLFNLTKIQVKGNEQIPQETIQSLSGLVLDQNLFQFSKMVVVEKIKENPYIDSVQIKRKLPNVVEIQVKERHTKYILLLGNAYLYMNRQGYFLELSETTKEVPIIKGIHTREENLVPGNRLDQTDLEKLETVNIIMKEASNNELESSITSIDITNKNNYILILEQEGKTAYLGEGTNMTSKMLALKEIIEKEKGRKGEIFLNSEKRIFREQV